MSYSDIVAMVGDWDLRMRIVACVAAEQDDGVLGFVEDNIWRICSTSGWEGAWAKAADATANDEGYKPGADETVIGDGMIRDAVLTVVAKVLARVEAAEALLASQTAVKRQEEDDRQFAAFVRARRYEVDNPRAEPPVRVPHLVTDDHPDPEGEA